MKVINVKSQSNHSDQLFITPTRAYSDLEDLLMKINAADTAVMSAKTAKILTVAASTSAQEIALRISNSPSIAAINTNSENMTRPNDLYDFICR